MAALLRWFTPRSASTPGATPASTLSDHALPLQDSSDVDGPPRVLREPGAEVPLSEGEAREALQRMLLAHDSSRFSPLRQLRPSPAPGQRSNVSSLLINARAAACLCVLAYSEDTVTQGYAAGVLQEAAEGSGGTNGVRVRSESAPLPPVVQADVVRASLALLQSLDARTQVLTVMALTNLARHDENRRLLVRGGLLASVVVLARSSDSEVRGHTVALVRLLAMSEESRGVLGKSDSLEALFSAVRGASMMAMSASDSSDAQLCRDALDALCELAHNEGNHVGMLAMGLTDLTVKAASPDVQLAQRSLHVLQRLARHAVSRTRIAGSAALMGLLVRYAQASDVTLQACAVAVLSYVLQGRDEAEQLLHDDVTLAAHLHSLALASVPVPAPPSRSLSASASDDQQQRQQQLQRTQRRLRTHSAHAVAAIGSHPSTYTALPRGALLAIFRAFVPPVQRAPSQAHVLEDLAIAAKALLFHLNAERTQPQLPPPLLTRADMQAVSTHLLNCSDVLVRSYCAAIVRLALVDAQVRGDEVGVAPCVPFALDVLVRDTDGVPAKLEAALALEAMATERAHHADLLRHHHSFVPALVSSNAALLTSAMRTLARLAAQPQGAAVLGAESQLLGAVLTAARHADVDVHREALALITCLCVDPATALRVAQAGAVEPLLLVAMSAASSSYDSSLASALLTSLLARPDEGAIAALTAMRNVTASQQAHLALLVQPSVLEALVGLLAAKCSADVQWHAARAVARLAERGQAQSQAQALIAQALHVPLCALLGCAREARVATAAAEAVGELAKSGAGAGAVLLSVDTLAALGVLLAGDQPDAQRASLAALTALLALPTAVAVAHSASLPDALRTAATHAPEPTRSQAAQLLALLTPP